MAGNYGPAFVLTAGALTFGNEWLQTGGLNWRVPVATLLGAGTVGLVGQFSASTGNILGVMILIAASATRFNGKSALEEFTSTIPKAKP